MKKFDLFFFEKSNVVTGPSYFSLREVQIKQNRNKESFQQLTRFHRISFSILEFFFSMQLDENFFGANQTKGNLIIVKLMINSNEIISAK